MSIFALRKIEAVTGIQNFFELLVEGKSNYESFTREVQSNPKYYSELKTILSYMNLVADLRMLPQKKFRDITPVQDSIRNDYKRRTY